jgi:DNA damage-binding protein 1
MKQRSMILKGLCILSNKFYYTCFLLLSLTNFAILRIDLEPHEMILSIVNVYLGTQFACQTDSPNGATNSTTKRTKPYIVIGTAYALPDEDEPTKGRVLVLSCDDDEGNPTRSVKHVTELHVNGGVYSMCQFYNGSILITVNCKTQVCNLVHDGVLKLSYIGMGHHGHILSLLVQSRASKESIEKTNKRTHKDMISPGTKVANVEEKDQLAIVGDLMRSISLLQYYPEHKALEEIARDFNCNWTTAIAMLSDNLYLGAENWGNIFMLKRNSKATSEEIRCRLETVGRYHLGEMCNKFVRGSLTMSQSNSLNTAAENSSRKQVSITSGSRNKHEDGSMNRIRRPFVTIGSQTLFGTVDGTLGCILGLNARTAAFFATLERAMSKKVYAIGNFSHTEFRTFNAENRGQPAYGFVDGDLIETFLDLDSTMMQVIVDEMNRDGGWELDSIHRKKVEGEEFETVGDRYLLKVEDVLAMVEEISMMH